MINFKFLKVQISYSWVIPISFIFASFLLVIPGLIGPTTFSPLDKYYPNGGSSTGGAGNFFFFVTVSGLLLASISMVILVINKLFVKEIDRGYIGAWLVLPINKIDIYITKVFVIIIYLLTFYAISLGFQEIIFSFLLQDFSKNIAIYFLTLNFSMLLVSLLFAAMALVIISLIKKSAIGLSIISAMIAIFIIFYLIGLSASNPNNFLHPFQFLTIYYLVQSPANFDFDHPIKTIISKVEYYQYYPIVINWFSLAWKLPVTTILSILFLIWAPKNLKNRNLSI